MPKRVTASAKAGPLSMKDSMQNFAARLGLGADNMSSGSTYSPNYTSRNRFLLDSIYRSSWIAGQAVDAIAQDMTREGVTVKGKIAPTDMEKLETEATKLRIWKSLGGVIRWARLYGGAVGWLMIDGQRPETPLRLETVAKGQFKGILPLDRWMLQPLFDEFVTDLGPDYGKPKFYRTIADNMGMITRKIHYSRIVRMEGVELPYYSRIAENGWGQSVIERLFDRLVAYDSTTQGTAQLVYRAHLRMYGVKGLRAIIAQGGKAYDGLVAQLDMIRKFQSNEGLTLIDSEDEFEAHSYTFSGLDSVLQQFGEQISGATGIPLVRLFGQSPAGLNSTGESDIRNYYDNVSQTQENDLLNPATTVYELLYRSTFGREPPEDFALEFNPLWQMSDTDRAENGAKLTTAIVGAYDSGVTDRATALRELRQQSAATGLWTNIDDAAIEEAKNDPPPGAPGLDPVTGEPLEAPPAAPGAPGAPGKNTTTNSADPAKNDKRAAKTGDADFNEADHPRAPNGEFGMGSGANTSGAKYAAGKRSANLETAKNVLTSAGHEVDVQFFSGGEIARTLGTGPGAKIILNSGSDYWFNPASESKKAHKAGLTSSPDPFHALHHEASHVRGAYPNESRDFEEGEREVAATVSKYAASNRNEFLAEYSAARATGAPLSEAATKLYEKLSTGLARK